MEIESRFLLDKELFDDLKTYLEEKRNSLREALLYSIAFEKAGGKPLLRKPSRQEATFATILNEFDAKCQELGPEDWKRLDHEVIIEKLSNILWNYVEILEGMCRELFDQLKGIPIDWWDQDLYDRVEATKVYLWDKLQEIDQFLSSLEVSLKKFSLLSLKDTPYPWFKKIRVKLHKVLDPALEERVKKSEKYLHSQFKEFSESFIFLRKAEEKLEIEDYRFQGYLILNAMETDKQRHYRRLWRLLKLSKAAGKEKKKAQESIDFTLTQSNPPQKTIALLKDYIAFFKENVYDLALKYRRVRDISAQAIISVWKGELSSLTRAIVSYKEFLIGKDVERPRFVWGPFGKKESENPRIQELNQLHRCTIRINNWLSELFDAQEVTAIEDPQVHLVQFRKAEKLLHDMSQPLISKNVMKTKSNELVHELTKAKELTSELPQVSILMLETLLRAFKADAKHETLTESEEFASLWDLHRGLSRSTRSIQSEKRLRIYKSATEHILHWLHEQALSQHTEEKDHEIQDLQVTMQEFYHSIHSDLPLIEIWEIKKELLEERVFFAIFFRKLKEYKNVGRKLRSEFAFVDKYYDAIDQKLNLQKAMKEPNALE